MGDEDEIRWEEKGNRQADGAQGAGSQGSCGDGDVRKEGLSRGYGLVVCRGHSQSGGGALRL